MPDTTYQGGCHCGAVSFQVTMAPPAKAYACNCSICGKAGWLLAFVGGDAFKLVAGEEALTDYQFGKRAIHHTFCRTCGVRPFSRGLDPSGKLSVAVNLRCLKGLDPAALPVESFDGASL
ncbi:MAG: GFA family protein [Anaeromyxobacter sp.]|nr:GFA family protein [Anaeromyxobacter sp.]MBL0275216.1 GFA family protein [Anaeromyxobacter sp.]